MARITLDMPETYYFSTELCVRMSDTNGGHMSNYAVLALVNEARIQFLNHCEVSDDNIIVTDSAIVYKAEGFYGDRLKFEVTAADFNKYGGDIFYKVSNADNDTLIAESKTGIVFYDYEASQMMALPEAFKQRFI